MNINEVLTYNNVWKELYKNVVDNGANFSNFQKNLLKMGIEYYFEERRKYIINYYDQAHKNIITSL